MESIIKKLLLVVMILLSMLIILSIVPIKKTSDPSKFITDYNGDNNEITIFCMRAVTTGPPWGIIREDDGKLTYKYGELIKIEGSLPNEKLRNFLFVNSKNRFAFNGHFTDKIQKDSNDPSEQYGIFHATGWEILGPIDRGDSLRFFSPKNALTLFDYKW